MKGDIPCAPFTCTTDQCCCPSVQDPNRQAWWVLPYDTGVVFYANINTAQTSLQDKE